MVDNGRPQQRESCRVILDVVERPVESPHPPVFQDEPGVHVSVTENDPIGSFVKIMSATDEDDEKLWYSIADGRYMCPCVTISLPCFAA